MGRQVCKALPAVTRKKDWQTTKLADGLTALLGSVPADLEKQLKGAIIREHFAQAIIEEYGTEAAAFILKNIQGVYLRKDDAPAKANSGPAPVYLDIYTTEAIIKADLDNRQEALKWRLRKKDVYFDRLKPFSSTGDMRYRKPFETRAAELVVQSVGLNDGHPQAGGVAQGNASGKKGTAGKNGTLGDNSPEETLTHERIEELVATIENPGLARALRRAMEASAQ